MAAVSDGRTRAERIGFALLEHARLSDAEAVRRIANARDESYWRALVPDPAGGAANAPSAVDVRAACQQLQDEGYFQTPPIQRGDSLARCNHVVDAVVAAGWPPVFAWIYDEIWQCSRLPELHTILTSALGWTFDVLHWGGPVESGERHPVRRPISMEFIAAGEPLQPHETPLVEVSGAMPAFAGRVQMIGRALGTYEHFEPRLARWRAVAAGLA